MNLRNAWVKTLFTLSLSLGLSNCAKFKLDSSPEKKDPLGPQVAFETEPFAVSPFISPKKRTPVRTILDNYTYLTNHWDNFRAFYPRVVTEVKSPLVWDDKTADLFISPLKESLEVKGGSLPKLKRYTLARHAMAELHIHAFYEKVDSLGEIKREPLLGIVPWESIEGKLKKITDHPKFINSISLSTLVDLVESFDSDDNVFYKRDPQKRTVADPVAQSFGFDSAIDLFRHVVALADFYVSTHELVREYVTSNGGENLKNWGLRFDPTHYPISWCWDPVSKRFQTTDF